MKIKPEDFNKGKSMVEMAIRYLKADKVSVIPVGKNKIPLVPWKQYQDKFPTQKQIKEWWQTFPDAQIGICTGKLSNLTVVDIENGGDRSYLPQDTLIVKTGGNGRHYYFQYFEGIKNKARIKELTDIRGSGGYVVAPPSVSDKGSYEIINLAKPIPFPIELFPGILENNSYHYTPEYKEPILKPDPLPIKSYLPVEGNPVDIFKEVTPKTAEEQLVDSYPGFPQGQRNEEMTRFIGTVLKFIHPSKWDTDGWEVVLAANKKNDPELPYFELGASFRSIKGREVIQATQGGLLAQKTLEISPPQPIPDGTDEVKHIKTVAEEQKLDQTDIYPLEMPCFDDAILGGVCPGDLVIIAGKTGEGKCVDKNTKICCYDGTFKKAEDIRVGDLLMGPDSKPRKVLSITSGTDEMYKIDQIKGDSYTVNSKHILSLKRTQNCLLKRGKPAILHKGEILNIPVEEYINKSKWFKHMYKGWQCGPIGWSNPKKVKIDPYYLGAWLGDGSSHNTAITSMDKQVFSHCIDYAEKLGLKTTISKKDNNKASTFSFVNERGQGNVLLKLLKGYKVINNKHIPHDYKINSREVRLQILAGMIDTDGYVNHSGYVISNKNKNLIEDFAFIARSLGFRCLVRKTIKGIKSIGFTGEYWKLSISGDCSIVPVKIPRKKVKIRKQIKDVLLNGIKVTPVGKGKYYGFELNGDGLFLLGDFTVTHNSSLAMDWTLSLIRGKKKAPVLWFSYELLPTHLWAKFQKMGMKEEDVAVIPARHSSGNIAWVEAKIKEAKEKFGVKAVVIDHLGFLLPKTISFGKNMSSNYSTFLTQITREIKTIAIQEEVIIILPVHMRKTSKVDMDAIKDSAGISQESDLVFLIEREMAKGKAAKSYYTDYTKITLSKNRKTGVTVVGWFKMFNERFTYDTDKNNIEDNENQRIDKMEKDWKSGKPLSDEEPIGPVASSPVNHFGYKPIAYEDAMDKKVDHIVSGTDKLVPIESEEDKILKSMFN